MANVKISETGSENSAPAGTTFLEGETIGGTSEHFEASLLLSSVTNGATAKTTMADADRVGFWDSVSGLWRHITWLKLRQNLNADGWIPVTDTWTYASASTITIPTDGTTTYQKGVKIRLKQGGGYKYYVANTVAATLITVLINTDYTVANAAITDISYSYIENPLGWPNDFNFTTVITPLSGAITSYTVTAAKYRVSNGRIYFYIFATITNNGTGSGAVVATHPGTVKDTPGIFREYNVGYLCYGTTQGGSIYIRKYDETYPGATGNILKGAIDALFS